MILFFCRFVKALGESSGNLTCLLKFCLIFSRNCQSSTQQCSRQTDRTETDGNTAQRASGDFARHLLANFPSEPVSYLPARICRTIFVRYCRIYFAGKWNNRFPAFSPQPALFPVEIAKNFSTFCFSLRIL